MELEVDDELDNWGRRRLLKALPLTAAGLALSASGTSAQPATSQSSRALVAFYSRTGNTAVVARQIRRAQDATLFEIQTRNPYPEDYEATVEQARRETAQRYLPALGNFVADLGRYDLIYLGMPIWGMTAPPVIRSFLRAHDFSGKVVVPFITHGGYGVGNSQEVFRTHLPAATLKPAFSMEAGQERRTLEQVSGWLDRG
ncbi:flavodoxin [Neorhizobium sp. JUb45]|uniref:flavodoxin n=1 Tax=unclassified Neorhizobium TaxID=2629175 RepID=UPI0010450F50|nr:flavodoxin [Neorhizobium sp. JUb45]TCR00490.1 flavodoxin [Neorhizobium sp. JUb45]